MSSEAPAAGIPSPTVAGFAESHPTATFLVRRTARMIVALLVLLVLSFSMIHLVPGDPVRAQLGPRAPASLVEHRRAELGLDNPLPVQFADYVKGLFTGDLGMSSSSNLPVSDVIGQRLPHSAALAGIAFLVIMLLSVSIGMAAAVFTKDGRGRGTELAFTTTTGFFATIPEFVLGVGLVYLFGVELQVLPVAYEPGPAAYILPVAALSLGSIAALARIVRAETLEVLGADYMRTARSKRLPARLLYLRHALPNMLTSTLTLGGLLLSGLVGGTVLVENVFAWPGLGTTVVDSVVAQDYPLAQAIMLLLGATVLVVNLVVDLILGVVDPRSTIKEM
jgi:ABC-type dipeptide/oligopeptide/nickel transport system permease component